MRILHVITMLEIGGAERLMVDLLPLLRDKGNEVDLLLFNGAESAFKSSLEETGIKIYELAHGKDIKNYYKEVYDPRHIYRLRKFMKGYDIIHTHNSICQFYLAIAKSIFGSKTPLVTTEHSTSNRRRSIWLFKPIDRWMYNCYAAIICVSGKAADILSSYLGRSNRLLTILNGIDTRRFSMPIADISKRANFQITMIAAFRKEKDHATLLRAMALLPNNYKLQLVGRGYDDIIDGLKKLCYALSISDRVDFTGPSSDIPSVLKNSDVVVLSSHWEGFGLAAVEAMAAGRPLVASDVGGLRDVVAGAGVLFPHGDEKELAKHIQYLCEHPDEYRAVAERCQERARQYDISVMADKYLELYQELYQDN